MSHVRQWTPICLSRFSQLYLLISSYGIIHTTSSPRYPQSNGEAERGVETVKNLIKKSSDPLLATPLANGYSPAQLLIGRQLRTTLPTLREHLIPHTPSASALRERETNKSKENRKRTLTGDTYRTKELVPLQRGDTVWIPDRQTSGEILNETIPRSDIVNNPKGLVKRNRRHINPLKNTIEEGNGWQTTNGAGEPRHYEGQDKQETTLQQCQEREEIEMPTKGTVTRSDRLSKPPERLDL